MNDANEELITAIDIGLDEIKVKAKSHTPKAKKSELKLNISSAEKKQALNNTHDHKKLRNLKLLRSSPNPSRPRSSSNTTIRKINNRMYYRAMKRQKTQEQRLKKIREDKEEECMREATFQPKINLSRISSPSENIRTILGKNMNTSDVSRISSPKTQKNSNANPFDKFKLREIFNKLGPANGVVEKISFQNAMLSTNVRAIIVPLVHQLNVMSNQLNFEEFCFHLNTILESLSPQERNNFFEKKENMISKSRTRLRRK